MRPIFFALCFSFFVVQAQSQPAVYPTHWWTGMKSGSLQLMLHQKDIGEFTKVTTRYPGVTIQKVSCPENKNYLFIDLVIAAQTRPGTVALSLSGVKGSSKTMAVKY